MFSKVSLSFLFFSPEGFNIVFALGLGANWVICLPILKGQTTTGFFRPGTPAVFFLNVFVASGASRQSEGPDYEGDPKEPMFGKKGTHGDGSKIPGTPRNPIW